jgi:hypothetical protein
MFIYFSFATGFQSRDRVLKTAWHQRSALATDMGTFQVPVSRNFLRIGATQQP